jgi:alcohol dehydrogenase
LRAAVFNKALTFEPDRPEPTPGDGECLVRVHLAGICATDLHVIRGYMNFSGVLGHEFVGTVVAGSSAWRDKRVVCEINCVCRECDMCQAGLANHCRKRSVLGIDGRDGCFADLVAVPEHNLHAVPDVVSDEEAVFVEPLAAAYQVVVQCPVDERMNVSVVGPGRLGLLVAQVLASKGCRLTVIGTNPKKLLLCEKKGIQAVHVNELVPRQDRDVVVECSGAPEGLEIAMQLVRPRGTIILKSTYADPGMRDRLVGRVIDQPFPFDPDVGSITRPTLDQQAGVPPASRLATSKPARQRSHVAGARTAGGRIPSRALPNLAPLVINEVTLLGSRCGPFPEAIDALARQAVDVRSMISRTFPIEQALEAFQAAQDPDNVKVLLRIDPR